MKERIFWVLDEDGNAVECPDHDFWSDYFQRADRTIARTEHKPTGISISTVFLAINHSFGTGPPILFETAIFYPETVYSPSLDRHIRDSHVVDRYATAAAAKQGHEEWVERIDKGERPGRRE